jgi:hypothetical protein
VNRALVALLASFVVASALSQSAEPTSIRITTWNLDWFPNGSPHDVTSEMQTQRIKAAADVLRPISPAIILLQEVRDYEACAHLGEAIAPGIYHVAICSAFKEPFQRGLGKQQVAILSKYQAQAAWAEPWKSMNGVDPPRGFAFAWFKMGSDDIGVYSVHLKSNLITHGNSFSVSRRGCVSVGPRYRDLRGPIAGEAVVTLATPEYPFRLPVASLTRTR